MNLKRPKVNIKNKFEKMGISEALYCKTVREEYIFMTYSISVQC